MHPRFAGLLVLFGRLRHLHGLSDGREGRAVVVDQAEEVGSQVVRFGDERHRGLALVLALRDPPDHRRERGAQGAGVGRGAATAGDGSRRRQVVAEGAQSPLNESFCHGIRSV